MSHDLFVSYSSQDKAVADAVVSALENSGLRCWVAPRDVKPGADWGDSITEAISACKLVILVFSGHSNESKRVRDEIYYAISEEKIILPFRIENLDPTGSMRLHLSSRHWLDAYQPSWQAHINRLVGSAADSLGLELVLPAAQEAAPPPAVAGAGQLPSQAATGAGPVPAQPGPAAKQGGRRIWVGVGAGAILLIGMVGGGILLTRNGVPWLAAATPAPRPTAPQAPVATQPSASSPASLSSPEGVDDFESLNTEVVWGEHDESGSAMSCAMDRLTVHDGAASWGLRWALVEQGWGDCIRWFMDEGNFGDWSRGQGVSFWYRASAAGQPVNFWMYIGEPGTGYSVVFETTPQSTEGWVRLEIPWEEFSLAPWESEARNDFDPSRLNSYGFTVSAADYPVLFELLVDDVALLAAGDLEPATAAEVSVYCGTVGESPVVLEAGRPVMLYWKWTTESTRYRQDYIDAASFALQLDGDPVDLSDARQYLWVCEEAPCVTWELPSMTLGEGSHEVVMAVTLANEVLDGFDLDQNGNLDVYGPGEWVAPACEIILR